MVLFGYGRVLSLVLCIYTSLYSTVYRYGTVTLPHRLDAPRPGHAL